MTSRQLTGSSDQNPADSFVADSGAQLPIPLRALSRQVTGVSIAEEPAEEPQPLTALAESKESSSPEVLLPWWKRPAWWQLIPIDLLKVGGILLVVPALTNIKTSFFDGDTSKAASVNGVVDTARAAFTLLVVVQLGQLSDVVGRKLVLFLNAFASLLPLACLHYFPENLWYYFGTSAACGLLGGQISPAASAYVADCCPQDKLARTMGFRGAAISAIVAVAPMAGTVIEGYFGRYGVTLTAFVMQVLAAVGVLLLPESLPKENRRPFVCSVGCGQVVKTLRELSQRRGTLIWDLSILSFVKGLTMGIPLFFAFKALVDLTDKDFGILITIIGVCGILVNALLLPLLARCGWSPLTMINFALAVDALSYLGFCTLKEFPEKWWLMVLMVFLSLAGVYTPAITALATQGVDADKGFVLSAFAAIGSVTGLVSPSFMSSLNAISPLVPFLLAALLNIICLVFALRLRGRVARDLLESQSSLIEVPTKANP